MNWNSGGQVIKARAFVDYPDKNVDLSLIQLAAPATGVATIGFQSPDLAQAYTPGAQAVTMGWGTSKDASVSPSKTLQRVDQETAPNDTCAGGSNGVFCAGRPNNQGSGTCQFDSGAPYVWAQAGFDPAGNPRSTPYVAGTLRGLNNQSCGKPGHNDDWQATGPPYGQWIAATLATSAP